MESYKHSCPFCGQHIEYTVGYCGKQMKCPMCGQTVTFPAIPPRRAGSSARSKTLEAAQARKSAWKLPAAFAFLRDFEHWDVVGQCLVPFLIISALLAGAIFVKNKLGASSPVEGAVPVAQAEPGAWQKMTDLTKAEQALQAATQALNQANALLDYEQKARRRLSNSDQFQKAGADKRVESVLMAANAALRQFNAAESKYRDLGGTKDYRSQLRRY